MGIFNVTGTKKYVTPIDKPTPSEASLLDISDFYAVGKVPPTWSTDQNVQFIVNPSEISWGVLAQYGSAQGHLTTNEQLQYGSSKRDRIRLPGLILDSSCGHGHVVKWLDKLEGMARPGTNTFPPVLAFVWGDRVLQPIVLVGMSVRETGWVNGLVSRATVDLEFQFHKASVYQSSADQRRVESLTEREQKRIKTATEANLELDKDAAGRVKSAGNKITNVPNADQGKPITVNEKGEVFQGSTKIATYTKRDANGKFSTDSFTPVPQPTVKEKAKNHRV